MLNIDLKKLILDTFVDKNEFMNSTDLSYFYAILAEEEVENQADKSSTNKNEVVLSTAYNTSYQRFLKYCHSGIEHLAFSFTGKDLSVIFEKIKYMQKKSMMTFEKIKNQTLKLIGKNDIKGSDLNKIYGHTKGLPFEGKYDTFNEAIEKHLNKLKFKR